MLNKLVADPSHLKVLILSCPKTGNTWLRWLIHYAYGTPIVDLPMDWNDAVASSLPDAFVSHQHLWPTPDLVDWLVRNNVVVLTTIRHPADTLLSYFHYASWQDLSADPHAAAMKDDGERPGKKTAKYASHAFPLAYAVSLAWARLGAHVVRYEDMLQDPVSCLRGLADKIAPLDEFKIRAAAILCRPDHLTRPGLVDSRHIRTGTAQKWVDEIPEEIVEVLECAEPFKSACAEYSYDWDRSKPAPARFDYTAIDPFRGARRFDNGELIAPALTKIYLHEVVDASSRWPDPTVTDGDSFWNWLCAPCAEAQSEPAALAATFTNLMAATHRMRPDLQAAYPDPVDRSRMDYLVWFLGQAVTEFEYPWGLIAPVMRAYCDYLQASSPKV